jgi:fused signal recognition particle receptor
MFGFLRRKKPVEPTAELAASADRSTTEDGNQSLSSQAEPGPDTSAAVTSRAAATSLPPDAIAADPAPVSATESAPAAVDEPAPVKQRFWSRFIPDSVADAWRAPAAPADSPPTDDLLAPEVTAPPEYEPRAEPSADEPAPAGLHPWADEQAPAEVTPPQERLPRHEPAHAPEPTYLGRLDADLRDPVSDTLDRPQLTGAVVEAPALDAAESGEVVLVPAEQQDRKPWLARLKQGLSKTRSNLAGLFVDVKVDAALFHELETALLVSDAGVETTEWLLTELHERITRQRLTEPAQVKAALRRLLVEMLLPLEKPIDIDRATPLVMMIAGVNGAGKTTSIGKLAKHLRREGKTVLLAAGDTFRAAAREQLAEWGSRNGVEVIAQQGGDPAAVAFDAVSAGRARGTGVVLVDTAGRLPTQAHLMQELGKIRRVTSKAMADAPHEVLLVLDGNTGQNMLAQVKAFDDAVQLTGLIVTKLDGTAKGGALAALAHTRRDRQIPIYFIGIGEGIDDLQAFSAEEFAQALVG